MDLALQIKAIYSFDLIGKEQDQAISLLIIKDCFLLLTIQNTG